MVEYVGSPEHKRYPWRGSQGALRSDATPCPGDLAMDAVLVERLARAIADAIGRGWCFHEPGTQYPRKVWGWLDAGDPPRRIHFCARLTNRTLGQYKAWPITPEDVDDQMPPGVYEALWDLD